MQLRHTQSLFLLLLSLFVVVSARLNEPLVNTSLRRWGKGHRPAKRPIEVFQRSQGSRQVRPRGIFQDLFGGSDITAGQSTVETNEDGGNRELLSDDQSESPSARDSRSKTKTEEEDRKDDTSEQQEGVKSNKQKDNSDDTVTGNDQVEDGTGSSRKSVQGQTKTTLSADKQEEQEEPEKEGKEGQEGTEGKDNAGLSSEIEQSSDVKKSDDKTEQSMESDGQDAREQKESSTEDAKASRKQAEEDDGQTTSTALPESGTHSDESEKDKESFGTVQKSNDEAGPDGGQDEKQDDGTKSGENVQEQEEVSGTKKVDKSREGKEDEGDGKSKQSGTNGEGGGPDQADHSNESQKDEVSGEVTHSEHKDKSAVRAGSGDEEKEENREKSKSKDTSEEKASSDEEDETSGKHVSEEGEKKDDFSTPHEKTQSSESNNRNGKKDSSDSQDSSTTEKQQSQVDSKGPDDGKDPDNGDAETVTDGKKNRGSDKLDDDRDRSTTQGSNEDKNSTRRPKGGDGNGTFQEIKGNGNEVRRPREDAEDPKSNETPKHEAEQSQVNESTESQDDGLLGGLFGSNGALAHNSSQEDDERSPDGRPSEQPKKQHKGDDGETQQEHQQPSKNQQDDVDEPTESDDDDGGKAKGGDTGLLGGLTGKQSVVSSVTGQKDDREDASNADVVTEPDSDGKDESSDSQRSEESSDGRTPTKGEKGRSKMQDQPDDSGGDETGLLGGLTGKGGTVSSVTGQESVVNGATGGDTSPAPVRDQQTNSLPNEGATKESHDQKSSAKSANGGQEQSDEDDEKGTGLLGGLTGGGGTVSSLTGQKSAGTGATGGDPSMAQDQQTGSLHDEEATKEAHDEKSSAKPAKEVQEQSSEDDDKDSGLLGGLTGSGGTVSSVTGNKSDADGSDQGNIEQDTGPQSKGAKGEENVDSSVESEAGDNNGGDKSGLVGGLTGSQGTVSPLTGDQSVVKGATGGRTKSESGNGTYQQVQPVQSDDNVEEDNQAQGKGSEGGLLGGVAGKGGTVSSLTGKDSVVKGATGANTDADSGSGPHKTAPLISNNNAGGSDVVDDQNEGGTGRKKGLLGGVAGNGGTVSQLTGENTAGSGVGGVGDNGGSYDQDSGDQTSPHQEQQGPSTENGDNNETGLLGGVTGKGGTTSKLAGHGSLLDGATGGDKADDGDGDIQSSSNEGGLAPGMTNVNQGGKPSQPDNLPSGTSETSSAQNQGGSTTLTDGTTASDIETPDVVTAPVDHGTSHESTNEKTTHAANGPNEAQTSDINHINSAAAFGYADREKLILPTTKMDDTEGDQKSANLQASDDKTATDSTSSASSKNLASNANSQSPMAQTIVPKGTASTKPQDSTMIALLFKPIISWQFLASSPETVAQIFLYMPSIIAEAVQLETKNVSTIRLQSYSSDSSGKSNTGDLSLYLAYVPSGVVNNLQALVKDRNSSFYSLPSNAVAKALAQNVDPDYDILKMQSLGSADRIATETSSRDSSALLRDALIGVGSTLAACILAFIAWRIWKKNKKMTEAHARQSMMSTGVGGRARTIASFGGGGNNLRETWAPSVHEQERVLHGQLAETWEHSDAVRGNTVPDMTYSNADAAAGANGGIIFGQAMTSSAGHSDPFHDAVTNRASQETERSQPPPGGRISPRRNTLLSHIASEDPRSRAMSSSSQLTEAQRIQQDYIDTQSIREQDSTGGPVTFPG